MQLNGSVLRLLTAENMNKVQLQKIAPSYSIFKYRYIIHFAKLYFVDT